MSKAIPPVQKYMTAAPHTIATGQTVREASDLMRQHSIRHLPVMKGEHLMGMLSERDVAVISAFKDVDPGRVPVEQAMSEDPYTVGPDTPVNEVAAKMAANRYGSAIVVHQRKVVGVFTAVDACRVLAEVFDTRLK